MADVKIRVIAEDKASGELKKVDKSLEDIKKTAGEAGESGKGMGVDWTMALIGINQALEIAAKLMDAFKQAYEFAKEGAELEYLQDRFDNLSASIGTTSDFLLIDLREATRGIMSDAELMAGATDLMALGLANSHDEAVRLASAAGALNMNMDQLTLTITNKTIRRFDTLGISVDGFTDKVKALEAAGMDADAAFKEAFLQQAEAQIERVGHAADSAAGDFERLESGVANLTDAIKGDFATSALPVITMFADELTVINSNRAIEEMEGQLRDLGYTAQEIEGLWKGKTFFLFDEAGAADAAVAYIKILKDELTGLGDSSGSIEEVAQAISKATDYSYDLGTALGITTGELEKMDAKTQKEMAKGFEKAAEEARKMAEQFAKITSLEGNLSGIKNLAKEYDKILGSINENTVAIEQYQAVLDKPLSGGYFDGVYYSLDQVRETLGNLGDQTEENEDLMKRFQQISNMGYGGYIDGVWVSTQNAKKGIEELTEANAGLEASMAALADQVVLDMFEATIAIGGVTEAEFEAYMALGVKLGKWSQEAADDAIATFGGAIDEIKAMEIEDKEIIFNFNKVDPWGLYRYEPPDTSSTHTIHFQGSGYQYYKDYLAAGGVVQGLASGGEVHAAGGLPIHAAGGYWVGEAGPEPFFPAQDGRIVSNTQAVQALREGGGQGPETVNVVINTPFNFADRVWAENELAPLIRNEIQKMAIRG